MLNKPPQYGAHQQYHVARNFVHKVPPNFKLEIAATMPVVVETAADGLINQLGLKLGSKEQNPILIWGGAGSVGSAAIQLAKAAGCYPIITTASPKNHATLLSLGADKCFDYRATDVEQQISAAMNGKKFPYVFDCVVAKGNENTLSSTKICENLSTADAKCAAALPIVESEKKWPRVFACRSADVDFILPNGHRLVHKANLPWQEKMDEAFTWAIEHYGNGFVMPNVKVVKGGQESLEALRISAAGSASLEKFAIQHPL
jgi:threonine dehydrogenase-like Zn-dependent dehydrogenase